MPIGAAVTIGQHGRIVIPGEVVYIGVSSFLTSRVVEFGEEVRTSRGQDVHVADSIGSIALRCHQIDRSDNGLFECILNEGMFWHGLKCILFVMGVFVG